MSGILLGLLNWREWSVCRAKVEISLDLSLWQTSRKSMALFFSCSSPVCKATDFTMFPHFFKEWPIFRASEGVLTYQLHLQIHTSLWLHWLHVEIVLDQCNLVGFELRGSCSAQTVNSDQAHVPSVWHIDVDGVGLRIWDISFVQTVRWGHHLWVGSDSPTLHDSDVSIVWHIDSLTYKENISIFPVHYNFMTLWGTIVEGLSGVFYCHVRRV